MVGEKNTAEWQELAYNNDVLKKELTSYTRYPVLANDMREELKVVCPSAKSIILSKASESFVDSASIKKSYRGYSQNKQDTCQRQQKTAI